MKYSSVVDQLRDDWENRGWDSSVLNSFRMEMAAADSGSSSGDASSSNAGDAGQGSEATNEGAASDYSQMATGFLGRVPQEHRSILEPYVKQWDAGVTRRFQELQSQVAAYNGYDPQTVAQAMSIAEQLEENPWAVYGTLQNALLSGEYGPQPQDLGMQQDQGQLGPQQQQQVDPNDPMAQFPEEFRNEWNQIRQVVTLMGQQMLGQSQQAQQAQEQEQLDSYLEGLHNEYGDFDDQWVLLQILNDQSYDNVEQHITGWQEKTNSRNMQQQEAVGKLPQLLGSAGGNGVAPLDSASVKNLSRTDTKSLVASVLEQAARSRQ